MRCFFLAGACFVFIAACHSGAHDRAVPVRTIGSIIRVDSALDDIMPPGTVVEVIDSGLDWSEGPLWIEDKKMLLFSDVPQNVVYQWTEGGGRKKYLAPSGYTGQIQRGGEMGSNGLALDREQHLLLCQHGNRQIARMNAALDAPKPDFVTVAGRYNGKKFNSPNDLVIDRQQNIYFTDPPYGLEKQVADPGRELNFQGVYEVKPDGSVILLVDSLTRPNGLAFLPGDSTLIIANSDSAKPYWYSFAVHHDTLMKGKIFYSAAGFDPSEKGLPDGLKVDRSGHVFATGPGGVWIFDHTGKLLGRIKLSAAASNCALTPDEKTLFITNDMYVLRVRLSRAAR